MRTDDKPDGRVAMLLRDHPEQWAQAALAYRLDGKPVDPNDPEACRRCLLGLVLWQYGEDSPATTEAIWRLARAVDRLGFHSQNGADVPIITWNDAPGRIPRDVQRLCEQEGV